MVCAPHVPDTGRQTRVRVLLRCRCGARRGARYGARGGGTRPSTRQDDNRAWPDQDAHLPTSPRAC
eukprot:scaffold88794_cov54-Phaeocystis_antarctica.AAC.4